MNIRTGINLNFRVISESGDELAVIKGHTMIADDLKEVYDNFPMCPWSFTEWLDTISLEPWLSMESMSVESSPNLWQEIWQR
jgi:hypothetical protein